MESEGGLLTRVGSLHGGGLLLHGGVSYCMGDGGGAFLTRSSG